MILYHGNALLFTHYMLWWMHTMGERVTALHVTLYVRIMPELTMPMLY